MVGPLLERLGIDPVTTYWEPDATSPTTSPTPCWRRTAASSSTRCAREADLGIAWDGDADRCFFIDDRPLVDGDFLTALLADPILGKHPGETVSTTCAPPVP